MTDKERIELRKELAFAALAAKIPFTVEELKELEEFIIRDNGEKRGNSMVPDDKDAA